MTSNTNPQLEREYEFALIVGGVDELSESVADALFEAGCDDATVSMQYGRLYLDFSRSAASLQDAILSAIEAVRKADIGAVVLRIDDCNLVTQADIAKRIGRSRQMVNQYMHGTRGPGDFPPPECHIVDRKPLWAWCEVSFWLAENDLIKPEVRWDAEVVAAINRMLELERQHARYPNLFKQISGAFRNVNVTFGKPSRRSGRGSGAADRLGSK